MKKIVFTLTILFTLVALLALPAAPVHAEATRTYLSGTDIELGYLNEPTFTFPNSNIHIRNMMSLHEMVSTDPRNIGYAVITMNANFDGAFCGPMWGTSVVTNYAEDGGWEGNWAGMMTAEGFVIKIVMHGTGIYEGLEIRLIQTNNTYEGYIIELP